LTVYSTHEGRGIPETIIGPHSFVGAADVIGVKIGEGVVIGVRAYVSKDFLEKGIYVSVPGREKKDRE
jgi:acetyltransferase-like isoleucine patch superfamily enzyme